MINLWLNSFPLYLNGSSTLFLRAFKLIPFSCCVALVQSVLLLWKIQEMCSYVHFSPLCLRWPLDLWIMLQISVKIVASPILLRRYQKYRIVRWGGMLSHGLMLYSAAVESFHSMAYRGFATVLVSGIWAPSDFGTRAAKSDRSSLGFPFQWIGTACYIFKKMQYVQNLHSISSEIDLAANMSTGDVANTRKAKDMKVWSCLPCTWCSYGDLGFCTAMCPGLCWVFPTLPQDSGPIPIW